MYVAHAKVSHRTYQINVQITHIIFTDLHRLYKFPYHATRFFFYKSAIDYLYKFPPG